MDDLDEDALAELDESDEGPSAPARPRSQPGRLDRLLGVSGDDLDEYGLDRRFTISWDPPTPLIVAVSSFLGAFLAVPIIVQVVATALEWTQGPTGLGAASGEVAGRLATGQDPGVTLQLLDLPLGGRALFQLLLAASIAGPALFVAWRQGEGAKADLGLSFRAGDIPLGLVIGVSCQLLVPLLYKILSVVIDTSAVEDPAVELTSQATDAVGVVLLLFMTVLVAPLSEEIYYRGLVLRAAERRYGPTAAVLGSATFFAVTHLQVLQLPALLLFGVVLAGAAMRTGRLGVPIFAHVGFNLTTVVLLLTDFPFG